MAEMKLSVVSILVVVLALAGCGGGSSSTAQSSTTQSGATAPTKAAAPNAPAGSKVTTCGGGVRATDVDCGAAIEARRRWANRPACAIAEGASRASCSVGKNHCQAIRTDKGVSVSCAHPGGNVTFLER
jgi:hypothetical protein